MLSLFSKCMFDQEIWENYNIIDDLFQIERVMHMEQKSRLEKILESLQSITIDIPDSIQFLIWGMMHFTNRNKHFQLQPVTSKNSAWSKPFLSVSIGSKVQTWKLFLVYSLQFSFTALNENLDLSITKQRWYKQEDRFSCSTQPRILAKHCCCHKHYSQFEMSNIGRDMNLQMGSKDQSSALQ